MSTGVTTSINNDIQALTALINRVPTIPTIPTLESGATQAEIEAATKAYNQAISKLSSMLPEIQKSFTSALTPLTAQINGLSSSITASLAKVTPLAALTPIGGLSLSTMTQFATNVTKTFNTLISTVGGPEIASLTKLSSEISSLASSVSSLSSAISGLQAKLPGTLPGGVTITIPSIPALPSLPSIPSLPTV